MTRENYKKECFDLRKQLQATGRDYLNKFLEYWFWNIIGVERKKYRRDLQSFLRGSGYIHGLAEPYLFFERIDKFLQHHARETKKNEKRSLVKEED
jgi:hypothetical protein